MLTIETIYVEVMDPSSDLLICSDKPIQMDEDMNRVITAKLQKCFTHKGYCQGQLSDDHVWAHTLHQYLDKAIRFDELANILTKDIFDKKKDNGCYDASDLWIGETVYEERRYLIILDNAYKHGITHHIAMEDEFAHIQVIKDQGFYQDTLIKEDSVVLIECSDFSLQVLEKRADSAGLKIDLYANKILNCKVNPSYPQSVKLVTKAVEEVISNHELDHNDIVPKMKQMLVAGTQSKENVDVAAMAEELFSQPLIQKEFHDKLEADGLPAFIPTAQGKAVRKEKIQKLKTDNGIEISIPIDYMNQSDYVEINHQDDGTITIRIKNINHIKSK